MKATRNSSVPFHTTMTMTDHEKLVPLYHHHELTTIYTSPYRKDTESEGECVIMGYSDAHMYKELCNNTAAFLCIGTKG